MKQKAVIAFGSNMGDRQRYIEEALAQMGARAGKILAISDVIETKAYGYTDQADFLNGAVLMETELAPRQLLGVLNEIEAELDRVRLIHWGPRTIDLDIIFYGDQIIDEDDLHIPHADFANREFVLGPIAQIAPDLVDPRSGKNMQQLLAALMEGTGAEEEDAAGAEDEVKWTQAQQETIDTRDRNILVSAAAGSGKTAVLIERIKQLVLRDRTDIDRFLITTFTNAAAAEMKEKMERAIRKEMDRIRSKEDPASREDRDALTFLQRQLDLLPQANISTFHSFATGVMREFFYLTDLPPGFTIGDETRLSILRREAIDEVFEEQFADDPASFKAFLRKYSGDRSDERLKNQLLDVYQQLRSIPRYMDWAEERIGQMRGRDPLHALGLDGFLLEETRDALQDAIRWYEAAAQRLDRPETESLHLLARQDVERLQELRDMAARKTEDTADALAASLEDLRAALEAFKANRMTPIKGEKEAFELVKEDVKWLRGKGRDCISGLQKKYFSQPLEESGEILRRGADDTAFFVGLIRRMEEIYHEKKRARGTVDFDDCMHCCLEILEDEKAAADYRERFRYIFIDEYQDSNLLQEEIASRIAREDNLFMVGDVKQSIYKFRLAEPEIFRRRYEEYRSGKDPHSLCIDLNCNFRCRRTIRDAVNHIFRKIMDGYDEAAMLNGPDPEEGLTGYPVCLHILDKSPADGTGGTETAGAEGEANGTDAVSEKVPAEPLTEPELIARIIRDSLGKPIRDRDGTVRPVTCDDIAVLSRGGAAIPVIERYLNNEGIPAYGETAGGYYETVEIQVFLNLLQVISNPDQDVPLISAMSSVVFDFTPRELARIRIECRDGSYHQAVRRYEAEGADEGIRSKIRGMLDRIALWKEIGRTVPLDELMRTLLYETGYYDYCSGLPTGQQRTSNLRLLLEKAAAYEETSHLGLYGFLSYVDAMRRTRQNVSEASLMGEGRGAVRVMTVHKSKGLEFPVVILAGAGSSITSSSEGRAPVMHKDFAIGLAEVDRDQHWERKTLLQKAIAGKKTRENLEEEIRILYVALTRPMERLEIVASTKQADRLQNFPGRGSFLEMIYGTLAEMAEENPAAAQIHWHSQMEADAKAGSSSGEEPGDEVGTAGAEALDTAAGSEAAGTEAGPSGNQPEAPEGPSGEALREEIARRLSWHYPFEEEQQVRIKYSVTGLTHRREEGAEAPVIPELLSPQAGGEEWIGAGIGDGAGAGIGAETGAGTGASTGAGTGAGTGASTGATAGDGPEGARRPASPLTAPQIGTAMHTVMERIDFPAALEEGLPYIRRAIGQLHERGFLTDAEREAVKAENIAAFFEASVGARAARAERLCREKEFLLQVEIDGVPAVVQGVIDCFFEEEDGLVLIDYKNSWAASREEEERLIQRYGEQIRLYRKALQLALEKPVKESWLYLFRSRKFVRIDEL